jgi:hypothetical protein
MTLVVSHLVTSILQAFVYVFIRLPILLWLGLLHERTDVGLLMHHGLVLLAPAMLQAERYCA